MKHHDNTGRLGRLRWLGRLSAATASTVLVVLVAASSAGAHVVVSSPDAAPGEELGKVVFRVPNESEKAGTVRFVVNLPSDTPFVEVAAESKPGWLTQLTTKRLSPPAKVGGFVLSKVVTSVTWSATGDTQIRPGQFDEFALSVGPFPDDATTLIFPSTQVYSDGVAVDWNDPQPPGKPEPEHPAPTLDLTASASGGHAGSDSADSSAASETSATSDSSDTLARVLGGVSLLLALATIGFVVAGRRQG
jgi:uncharacterized protein YcnI